jgi:hypothetical protein
VVCPLRSFLGMMIFFSSHIATFSERASPLTDLLRGTTTGRQRLLWTPCCDQAFRDLKLELISTPVLRGFDPLLRTAVHVDGSQSVVGAVLLQWEEGQQDPWPVCFLSRKLQDDQFQYDAHNVEALAIQIALQEWQTLLYGVPFEICSDHRILHYLFSQKNPSQRILRLCEFLSDFNFKEVQYVKDEHVSVPNFLVVRRRCMRFPVQGQFVKDGRHTGCGSWRYVTGMLVWSKMWGLTGWSKDFFSPRWFHDTHARSRSYGFDVSMDRS